MVRYPKKKRMKKLQDDAWERTEVLVETQDQIDEAQGVKPLGGIKRLVVGGWLALLYPEKNIHQTSCEQLAGLLLSKFGLTYCKVLEDNENGAEVIL